MEKQTAIYLRTGPSQLGIRGQMSDLKKWVGRHCSRKSGAVKWYRDKTGESSKVRPGWESLREALDRDEVTRLVVWRLDRLGLSARHLGEFIEYLRDKRIRLVSVVDSFDSGTASGRREAKLLISLSDYEREFKGERIRRGQAKAMAKGTHWGGSKKGRRHKVSDEQVKIIHQLKKEGEKMARIARRVELSRSTIYRVLATFTIRGGVISLKGGSR